MGQEDKNRLIINDVLKLCSDISALYLNEKLSDVVLVIEGEKLYAHKTILAARSKYFENLFIGSSSKTEFLLTGITIGTLKLILKYIYTGTITLDSSNLGDNLDIVGVVSQFHLEDIKAPLISKTTKLIDNKNVFTVLDMANLYNLQDLIDACHMFLDKHAGELKLSDGFNQLSQISMVNLIKRDTFILSEIDIFQIVAKWRKSNTDLDDLVLKCVRLQWISIVDLVSKIWKPKLISCDKILNAISEIVDVDPKTSKPRAQTELDVNLATVKYNSEVITGSQRQNLLTGNRNVDKYCYHNIISEKTGITIKLGSVYLINNILMQLYDKDNRYYMYYIEVSLDEKNWSKILDYRMYACRSEQNLVFEPAFTKYIRITGTHSTANSEFPLVYFEAYYHSSLPKIINNVIIPTSNVALLEKKAVVIQGDNGNNMIDGDSNKASYTYHTLGGASAIIIQLAQPYMISSIRFRLWDYDSRTYKYYIETSTNKKHWEMAVDRRNQECMSWQDLKFSERATVFIKLTGTHNSVNPYFHIIHLESPSSST